MLLKRFVLLPTSKQPSTDNNICLSKHSNYYTEIQTNFLQIFQQKWKEENISESHSIKPLLMAWGYYADTAEFNHEYLADRAVAIELMQQSSNILLKQGDQAVLYAATLINKSITLLNEENILMKFLHFHTLTKITEDILKGRIRGVPIEFIVTSITEIVSNSYLLGYSLSDTNAATSSQSIEIETIGRLCEYCLQTLNDIKSFLSSNDNLQKNVIVSYLYDACSKEERNKLSEENINSEYIRNLVSKHKIMNIILEDINIKIFLIKKAISDLQEAKPDYCADFNRFLNETFKAHFQKCGLTYENKF